MSEFIEVQGVIYKKINPNTPSVQKPKSRKKGTQKGISKLEQWAFMILIGGLFILYAVTIIKNQWDETTEQGKTNSTINSTTLKVKVKNTKT